jgi:FKBP-type peptidyl-prolyl cis-trans isomerase
MMAGVYANLFQANGSEGFTTLERGVQFKDVRIGNGPLLKVRELAQVKYKLTAISKQFSGTTIELERSKDFKFRLGRGEVIQGWDIGMVGMRQGGTRKLIIPPKAGYGSQDIGAGPGAILNFEITLLSC